MNYIYMALVLLFLNLISIKCSELSEISEHLIFNLNKEDKNTSLYSEDNYIEKIMYKHLYSKFKIGIPFQGLKFYYETNQYYSSITEDDYDKTHSSTYKLIDNNTKYNFSQDLFDINKKLKLKNFTFVLKGKSVSDQFKNMNIIGLNKENNENNNNENYSFLNQLKKSGYINEKIYSFLFGDYMLGEYKGFEGQIMIGCLPHEINPLYDENDLKWISVKNKKQWNIDFDTVKYNNDELTDISVDLDLSLYVIVGPESFRKKILKDFFKKQIENNKCKENYFYNLKDKQFYIFYFCNMDAEFIEIPILTFYNKEFNETFTISFDKLFTKYNYKFYFNIVFKKNPENRWIFGQFFFKLYRFVFDLERERIGYYKTYLHKDHPIIAIFCFALILIIFGIAYLYSVINKRGNEFLNNKQIFYPVRQEYSQTQDDNLQQNKINDINPTNKKEKQN